MIYIKKKIAFVNQRYGKEVSGGSEKYTRDLAELLTPHYDVEVLTTCALDYVTWENSYTAGVSTIDGVKVRRFNVTTKRDQTNFNKTYAKLVQNTTNDDNRAKLESKWVDEQGPYCPDLVNYIKNNAAQYDVFIFVTYLYYHTVRAMKLVKNKAILIPTAHDEPPIYFNIYKEIFALPKAIGFLTEEERDFVHSHFANQQIPNDTIGHYTKYPAETFPSHFKEKYGLNNFILYVGRIEQSKGCNELCDFFIKHKKRYPSNLKLVFIGQTVSDIPNHEDIVKLGFVSEEDKFNGISAAKVLVLPSQYESLSIVTLEALAIGTPVLLNGKSAILRGHCVKSNAGLYYENFHEFSAALNYLLTKDDKYELMKENGKKYVNKNYSAEVFVERFARLVKNVV